jgi:predicted phage tail protein
VSLSYVGKNSLPITSATESDLPVLTLRGDLAQFGGPYVFAASSPWQLVSGLSRQNKKFAAKMRDGCYSVVHRRGDKEFELTQDMINFPLFEDSELIVTPAPFGAGRGKSTGKIIAGVALIAVSIALMQPWAAAGSIALSGAAAGTTGSVAISGAAAAAGGMATEIATIAGFSITASNILGVGVSLALTGIYQTFLAPGPVKSVGTSQDANASFIFSGPFNSTKQGGCIPVVMGEFICGSTVVSSDLSAERI